jgi:hypothetical protein
VVENHEGGTRMGIGVPISKVVPGKANQPKGNAAKPKGGEAGKAERGTCEPRSDTDSRSDAATRSDGKPGSAEETQCEARRRRDAATRSDGETRSSRESDSSTVYDGGAIFGQPHERKPGFAAGSQGPKRVGKAGVKVRRVARVRTKVMASGPIEGPRGPECGDAL